MTVMFVLIFSTLLLGVLSKRRTKITNSEYTFYRYRSIFFNIIALLFFSIMSVRGDLGDTIAYKRTYFSIMDNYNFIFTKSDSLFYALMIPFSLITNNPQFFLAFISIITLLLIFIVVRKYSASITISLYLLITSGMLITMMNGVRQYFAASIVFIGFALLIRNKKLLFIVLILIASFFHLSALFIIPTVFIIRRKPYDKVNITVYSILVLLSTILFKTLLPLVIIVFGGEQYSGYSDYILNENGANPIRIIVAIVPIILSIIVWNKIKKYGVYTNILVNFSIFNLIFSIFASRSWIFARFNIYFTLYSLLLFPLILQKGTNRNNRIILNVLFFVLYFAYFFPLI